MTLDSLNTARKLQGGFTTREEQIDQREMEILGQPPRIAPLAPEDFTAEAIEAAAALRQAAGLSDDGSVPNYVATMLRYPAMFKAHTDFAMILMTQGALTARARELAVLRTGWLCLAPFEWGAHVDIGRRAAGLTAAEFERVQQGSDAPEWNEADRSILKAVEEMMDGAMISDATWDVLARHYDDKQLIELPILVGQYIGVAYLQNSLRIRLMPGNDGLRAK